MNFEIARAQMLAQQIRAAEVLDDRVLDVLRAVPREDFVPPEYRELAFADMEIPIGRGQRMMAPVVEGRLLQALELEPIDRVLEVGTGTGFLTACLARLAGHVDSVDIYPEFVEAAGPKLARLEIHNVTLEAADALALERPGRYDAIAVTGSLPRLKDSLVRMLRPGGRMFVIVGRAPIMEAQLVTMHANGRITVDSLFETLRQPLVNAEQPEAFVL
ncbi:MAG TPA: protein-L-isoaspartate O-methyltransferase [Gammaproteobacteria bacterium]